MRASAIPEVIEMEDARLGRGTYTDETEMMVALAESLLACDVVDLEHLARSFLAAHDPRRGYGGGTTRVFDLWRRGIGVEEAALHVFDGRGSLGNGAAMRIAPVAIRYYEDSVLLGTQARRSARVTHAHPVGIDGAAVQAAAIAAALDDDDPLEGALDAAQTSEMRSALTDARARLRAGLDSAAVGGGRGVPPTADGSVSVAVVIGAQAASFEEAVTVAIRAGGDTDTAGAMAGAIAGARFGAESIPARWVSALEDGERGRGHVERLAAELAQRAQRAASGPAPGYPG